MRRLRIVLLWLLVVAGARPMVAQKHPNIELGFKPEKLYQFSDLDSVNLYNGNLILRIPLGIRYPVNDGFSYGLTLTYNSKVWDYHREWGEVGDLTEYYVGEPSRRSNAGLGWRLSMGRLLAPSDPLTEYPFDDTEQWVYEGPAGDEHAFAGFVPATSTVSFSTDGLRLVKVSSTERKVEFPDGNVHTFKFIGTHWRLDTIADRLGNSVKVEYARDSNTDRDLSWTIRDSHNRTHTVTFTNSPVMNNSVDHGQIVASISLASYGQPAVYDFQYDTTTAVTRGCQNYPRPGSDAGTTVQVPLLTGITLPDQSTFAFEYNATNVSGCNQGTIRAMTLPTKGRVEYGYRQYELPGTLCYEAPVIARTPGVAWKSTPDGRTDYVQTRGPAYLPDVNSEEWVNAQRFCRGDYPYLPHPEVPGGSPNTYEAIPPSRWSRTTVLSPPVMRDGEEKRIRTDNYFDVWTGDPFIKDPFRTYVQNVSTDNLVFGNPVTSGAPSIADATKGVDVPVADVATRDASGNFLSTRVFEKCDVESPTVPQTGKCLSGTLLRSTFSRYQKDTFDYVSIASRTVFHDDPGCTGGCWTQKEQSDSNGAGRFRKTTFTTNFPKGGAYETYTGYFAWANAAALQDSSRLWRLDMFSEQARTESGVTARTLFCFNGNNGFLERSRVLAGASAGATDVVTTYDRQSSLEADQSTRVTLTTRSYGGDESQVTLQSDVCAQSFTGATPSYTTRDVYSHGALLSSAYLDPASEQEILKIGDYTIHANTGLVTASRDSSGVETIYGYEDKTARLKTITATGSAPTTITYTKATSSANARVSVVTSPTDGTGDVKAEYEYDSLGRILRQSTLMPGGHWSVSQTLYDKAGRKQEATEPVDFPTVPTSSITGPVTKFEYDAFGRATSVLPPEGSKITTTYAGARTVSQTSNIAMVDNATSLQETAVTRVEEYDAQERLREVKEKSGPGHADVVTSYTYDVGNRLKTVTMSPSEAGVPAQQRTFQYDLRGFLTAETHPESGQTTYGKYDVFGHAREKRQGLGGTAFDLNFTYDKAERLMQVDERLPGSPTAFRKLKEFQYGAANGSSPTDYVKGKLQTGIRYNYSPDQFGDIYRVSEIYGYRDLAGRKTDRTTIISRAFGQNEAGAPWQELKTVIQAVEYNQLGLPKKVTYPSCFGCSMPPVAQATLAYGAGKLTSVAPGAAAIGYWPNGLMHTVTHDNGMVDTQETGLMPRPTRLKSGDWSVCTPPSIANKPSQTAANPGTKLTVVASGTAPFQYKWYSKATTPNANWQAVGDWQNLDWLTVNPAQTTHYKVLVKNACKIVESDVATVTVGACEPPKYETFSDGTFYGANLVSAGTVLELRVTASGTNVQYNWYEGAQGDVSHPLSTTATYTTPPLTRSTSYWVNITSSCGTETFARRYFVALPAPQNVVAHREGTTNSIRVTWNAVALAQSYSVYRQSLHGEFQYIGGSTTTQYLDVGPLAQNVTYVYYVVAGGAPADDGYSDSPPSSRDLATLMTFTPVTTGMLIDDAHFQETLAALNVLRAANGWSVVTWPQVLPPNSPAPAAGNPITVAQLVALRQRFDEALSGLGIAVQSYSDAIIAPNALFIRAAHISELQGRTQ